ncbi:MAG: bis(5'-nucleosyl)-tetraphosphatase (symmetrical) YqeK [Treponema sp.]|nr:bis(5'-nucleosyl)-tetraphosphatase (symmetrical) YqeK [Candidatus Treponema equifaecale]
MVSQKFNDAECYEKIREYAQKNLSQKRYEHSVRVAETAAYMCKLYGLDENLGLIAGIAHDICKEISDEEMLALAKMDGLPIEGLEAKKTSLLHGRAAAVKIQSEFEIHNGQVIESIANHTFGLKNCGDLAKIIFVADKIEPGRPQSTDEYRANHFSRTLNGLVIAVLEENLEYLEQHGKKIAPASFEWLEQLRKDGE